MTSGQQPNLKTIKTGVKPSADIRGLNGIIVQKQHPSTPISHPSHPMFGDVCNESQMETNTTKSQLQISDTIAEDKYKERKMLSAIIDPVCFCCFFSLTLKHEQAFPIYKKIPPFPICVFLLCLAWKNNSIPFLFQSSSRGKVRAARRCASLAVSCTWQCSEKRVPLEPGQLHSCFTLYTLATQGDDAVGLSACRQLRIIHPSTTSDWGCPFWGKK